MSSSESTPNLGRAKLPQLYTHPRSISQKKRADLLELLDYIPPVHHAFYQQLNGDLPDTDDESDASEAEDPGRPLVLRLTSTTFHSSSVLWV